MQNKSEIKMRIVGWMGRQSYKRMWFGYQKEVESKEEAQKVIKELKERHGKAVKDFEYLEYGDRNFFELIKREGI